MLKGEVDTQMEGNQRLARVESKERTKRKVEKHVPKGMSNKCDINTGKNLFLCTSCYQLTLLPFSKDWGKKVGWMCSDGCQPLM